jgi:hypothetical protein
MSDPAEGLRSALTGRYDVQRKLGAGGMEHGVPGLLFSRPGMALQEFYRTYDVHPDGKRFLMLSAGNAEARRLSVIFNWRPEVQQVRESPR